MEAAGALVEVRDLMGTEAASIGVVASIAVAVASVEAVQGLNLNTEVATEATREEVMAEEAIEVAISIEAARGMMVVELVVVATLAVPVAEEVIIEGNLIMIGIVVEVHHEIITHTNLTTIKGVVKTIGAPDHIKKYRANRKIDRNAHRQWLI